MTTSTFQTLQTIAARMQDFLTASDGHLAAEKGQQVREVIDSMWMKYHEGDEEGAKVLGQQLLGFLETTENLVDQAQEEQSVELLTDSLQQELANVQTYSISKRELCLIFFGTLLLGFVLLYAFTWRDVALIGGGLGLLGFLISSFLLKRS